MPRQTNAVKKSKKSTTSLEVVETSEVQDTPAVVEPTDVEPVITESDAQVEDDTTDDAVPDSNSARVDQIVEMAKMLNAVILKLNKRCKELQRRVTAKERRLKRLEQKKLSNKKKGGSGGLKKLQPVYTSEFRLFVESQHQCLNDRKGDIILETLDYDDEGNLLISRENCLKLVNAYVRQNELQKYDDKKRIKMDVELSKLFPELAEQKEGKKVTQAENCYFHTLMGGINRHLKPQVTS